MKIALFRDNVYTYFRDIEDAEWQTIDAAMKRLNLFQHEYEIYHLVVLAWGELQEVRDRIVQRVANGTAKLDLEKLLLNRVLLNFISTGKAFVDHTRFALIRRYGEDSDQFKAYDEQRCATWDDSAAYRLIDGLRNYIVHRRLPIERLTTTVTQESPTAAVQASLDVVFSRDALLDDKSWNSKIKADLRGGPEDIDALAVCEEYYFALVRLADYRFAVDRELVEGAVETIGILEAETGTGVDTGIVFVPDDFRIAPDITFRLRRIERELARSVRSALAQRTLFGLFSDDVATKDGFGDVP
jgi:hypothetical protein